MCARAAARHCGALVRRRGEGVRQGGMAATAAVAAGLDPALAAPRAALRVGRGRSRRRVAAAAAAAAPSRGFELTEDGAYESWEWRGHRVNYARLDGRRGNGGGKPPVVLVHGFGGAVGHFRDNIGAIAATGRDVYAVDLLGLGRSEKPRVQYEIELWGEQISDFVSEVVEADRAIVCGNSLGSLSTLCAAAERPEVFSGVVLFNCAGGLNNKAVLNRQGESGERDLRLTLVAPIFLLLDALLKLRPFARYIFEKVRTAESVAGALGAVYVNTSRADEELVRIITRCAEDEGALDAFVSILTGPPGPTPQVCVAKMPEELPLLVLYGRSDTITPPDGPVGQFFATLPARRPAATYTTVDANHCPFDDAPEETNAKLLEWLDALE